MGKHSTTTTANVGQYIQSTELQSFLLLFVIAKFN